MRLLLLFILCAMLFSCKNDHQNTLKNNESKLEAGIYRAVLETKDSITLPFKLEIVNDSSINIFNAEEVIHVNDIKFENDSVYIQLPIFESYLVAKINDSLLSGYYVKPILKRVVPFTASKNSFRFDVKNKSKYNISGNWETIFSKGVEGKEYIAKGIFTQKDDLITGTFRTTTGDYRYLEGVIDGDQLKLSTFDGSHAFLFTATVTDSTMKGSFYSGNHWKEPFEAVINDNYELPSPNDLTHLNEGYKRISFTFPDENGNMVSLDDDRFKNKVVLVQIMGTWCPNCLDESKYYSNYYNNRKNNDIEIIALAIEYAKSEDVAFRNIKRLKEGIGIEYPVLLAQFGSSSKAKAQEKIPMLNHVLSYPTTIYIDKKGNVRKIHTGFNGPATGEKYNEFKSEFESFTDKLLME